MTSVPCRIVMPRVNTTTSGDSDTSTLMNTSVKMRR